MGLVKTLMFLLFLIVSTSGIQAAENGEQRAQRGGLGHQEMSYLRSEEHNQEPDKRTRIVYGSETYQSGNTFKHEPGSNTVYGAYTDQRNNIYRLRGDLNHTQRNRSVIRYGALSVQLNNRIIEASAGVKNDKGSRVYQEGNVFPDTEQNTDVMDILSKYIAESQANSNIHNSSNKQLSLSFDKLYFYFLIVLASYYLLE